MRLIVCLLVGTLVVPPIDAPAQELRVPAPHTRYLIISERAIADGLQVPPGDAQPGPAGGRDSLKNGTLTGAIIGAIAAAVFAAYVCGAIGEEGDPPCWRGVLMIAGLGAGVGAAAGAGIDALAATEWPRHVPSRFNLTQSP